MLSTKGNRVEYRENSCSTQEHQMQRMRRVSGCGWMQASVALSSTKPAPELHQARLQVMNPTCADKSSSYRVIKLPHTARDDWTRRRSAVRDVAACTKFDPYPLGRKPHQLIPHQPETMHLHYREKCIRPTIRADSMHGFCKIALLRCVHWSTCTKVRTSA